jgi:hypothetical protein
MKVFSSLPKTLSHYLHAACFGEIIEDLSDAVKP